MHRARGVAPAASVQRTSLMSILSPPALVSPLMDMYLVLNESRGHKLVVKRSMIHASVSGMKISQKRRSYEIHGFHCLVSSLKMSTAMETDLRV